MACWTRRFCTLGGFEAGLLDAAILGSLRVGMKLHQERGSMCAYMLRVRVRVHEWMRVRARVREKRWTRMRVRLQVGGRK